MPVKVDEPDASENRVFFGGINVYLEQKFWLFRHTPRWLDRLLNARGLLNLAGRQSGMTATVDVGELTLSMLHGEHGHHSRSHHHRFRPTVLQHRRDRRLAAEPGEPYALFATMESHRATPVDG